MCWEVKSGDCRCFVWTRVNDRRPASSCGAGRVLGSRRGKQPLLPPAPPAASPHDLGCVVLLGCRSAAVPFQAARLFSLPSLFSPHSYRKVQTWRLNALWPSSHLENQTPAIHCGISAAAVTHTHTTYKL